jgi:hypothetical protein
MEPNHWIAIAAIIITAINQWSIALFNKKVTAEPVTAPVENDVTKSSKSGLWWLFTDFILLVLCATVAGYLVSVGPNVPGSRLQTLLIAVFVAMFFSTLRNISARIYR